MKPFFVAISTAGLWVGGLGIGPAHAWPSADVPAAVGPPATVVQARSACHDRRCRHVGYDRHTWYRPYGYYRPYRADRHIDFDPFGVGLY